MLKIEGVTRGPEVDLETPLRCFFQEIARRLHEKHQKGGGRNYPGFEPGQPDPARFLKGLLIIDIP